MALYACISGAQAGGVEWGLYVGSTAGGVREKCSMNQLLMSRCVCEWSMWRSLCAARLATPAAAAAADADEDEDEEEEECCCCCCCCCATVEYCMPSLWKAAATAATPSWV